MNQPFVLVVGAVVTLFLASSLFSPTGKKPTTPSPPPPPSSPATSPPKTKETSESSDPIRDELKSRLPPEIAANFMSQKFQDLCVFVRGSKEERSTFFPLMKSLKGFLPRAGSFIISMEYGAYNHLGGELPKSAVPILTRDEYPEFYQRIYHKLTADLYCLRPYILYLDPAHFIFKSMVESDLFDEDGKLWVFTRNYTSTEASKSNKGKNAKRTAGSIESERDVDRLYSIEQQRKMVKKYLGINLGTSLDEIDQNIEKKQKEVFISHIKPKLYPIRLLKDLRDRIEATTGVTIEHIIHQLSRGHCSFGENKKEGQDPQQQRDQIDDCFFDVEILLSALLQANSTSSFPLPGSDRKTNTAFNFDEKIHRLNIDRPYDSLTQAEKLRMRRHFVSENQDLVSFFLESRYNILDSVSGQMVSLLPKPSTGASTPQTPTELPQVSSTLLQPNPSLIPSQTTKSLSRELEFNSPVYNDFVNSVLTGKCQPDGVELSVDWDYVFCQHFGVPFSNHLFHPNSPPVEHRAPTPPKKRRKPPTA